MTRDILNKLLEEAPDYADARANLNRLSFQNSSQQKISSSNHSSEPVQVGRWQIPC